MIREPFLGAGSHHSYSRITPQARAARLGHRGVAVLLDGGLGPDAADRVADLEVALFDRGIVTAQVAIDLDAAIALARAGIVALAAVAASGRDRARETLRAASVLWIEADASVSGADAIAATAKQGVV
jgi:hypothetical protein